MEASQLKEATMKTLLQLNTSLFSAHGQSTRLNDEFVAAWKAANPQGQVVVRTFASGAAHRWRTETP